MPHSILSQTTLFPEHAASEAEAIGKLTWSLRRGDVLVFLLELTNRPDNRLTPVMIDRCIMPALDIVEKAWRADLKQEFPGGPGTGAVALVTCGPLDKHRFYSNGLELTNGPLNIPHWFRDCFHKMLGRLLTFPVATVAALNGHAFAGGLTLALAHDYRILKDAPGKGGQAMMSLNEVHFGAHIPTGMCHLTRAKTRPDIFHKIAVEGRRFKGDVALEARLVDELAATGDETLGKALSLAEKVATLSRQAVVGLIKEEAYKHTLTELAVDVPLPLNPKRDATAPGASAKIRAKL